MNKTTSNITVIRPKSGWFDLHLGELAHYKDLIFLFVKRNFVSMYKQTVLGPAWTSGLWSLLWEKNVRS